jgi:membrane protein YqaA with SNARE-associated domain
MAAQARAASTVDAPAVQRPDRFVRFLIAHPLLVRLLIYGVVLGAIGTGLYLWLAGRLDVTNAGYTGVFIVNLVGSGAIVVPVPGFAAVCASASDSLGLNLPALATVGAAGAALGEITGYLAGFGGQGLVSRFRFYPRVHGWVLRRGGLALFILAALPNPLFDVAGFAAGGLGYPIHKFVVYVFAGKVIRFGVLAYACRLGIGWVQGLT